MHVGKHVSRSYQGPGPPFPPPETILSINILSVCCLPQYFLCCCWKSRSTNKDILGRGYAQKCELPLSVWGELKCMSCPSFDVFAFSCINTKVLIQSDCERKEKQMGVYRSRSNDDNYCTSFCKHCVWRFPSSAILGPFGSHMVTCKGPKEIISGHPGIVSAAHLCSAELVFSNSCYVAITHLLLNPAPFHCTTLKEDT